MQRGGMLVLDPSIPLPGARMSTGLTSATCHNSPQLLISSHSWHTQPRGIQPPAVHHPCPVKPRNGHHQKTIWPNQKTVRSGKKTVWSEKKTAQSDQKTIWSYQKAAWSDQKIAWSDKKTVWSDQLSCIIYRYFNKHMKQPTVGAVWQD